MKTLLLLLLIFTSSLSIGQKTIEELEAELNTATGAKEIKLLNSLAIAYLNTQPEKAIEYAEKGLKLNKRGIIDPKIEGNLYSTLGSAYFMIGDYKNSVRNYEKELNIIENTELDLVIMKANFNIATLYQILNNNKAGSYYEKSLDLAEKIKAKDVMVTLYEKLAVIYSTKNYEKSVYYFLKYFDAKKILNRQRNEIMASQYDEIVIQKKNINKKENEINDLEDNEKVLLKDAVIKKGEIDVLEVNEKALIKDTTTKSLKINLLDELNTLQRVEIKHKEVIIHQQKIITIISAGIILLILLIFSLFIWFIIRLKKMNKVLYQQNEEINTQINEIELKNTEINKHVVVIENKNKVITAYNEEIITQNEILTKQKKEITDSITYASLIQKAILPSHEIISEHFSEHFILYRPCKIVSGDFYWFRQIKNLLFIVAADCTGHGVPGAFMSMLGISMLNDIVNLSNAHHPHQTLNELRRRIKKSLHQTGKSGERQDGMDISFCMIDLDTNTVEFSGAYNPFYLVRNKELIEFKANRMPIGVYPKDDQEFTTASIKLMPNDKFYIFSDGYAAQFGGTNGKKFKTTQFREMLIQHYDKSMTVQKELLEEALDGWQGDMEQVDDILVIGINIPYRVEKNIKELELVS
jgi:serine phosphatase RsbU (regulator of sigma subunit)